MAAKFCSHCQQSFPTAHTVCPHDQTVLSLPDPYQMIGRTLLEKYRIEALVGLGGMGAVYCAYHTGLDRRVAFKILQPNIAVADEHLVELFEREAKVSGRLSHENIVDVKDAGRTPDGTAYIVMEWLEGRTLDEELRMTGAMTFARAGQIIRQIAAALSEAHSRQVVHRDLKPANVMLVQRKDGREVVKVLDFGIGKILTETGASVSAVMGTPSYASPEQLQLGGKIDGRSDIYSLGVILYRMLSGRLPFQSGSLSELVQMQLAMMPMPLRSLRPETPESLDALVMQMLAKNQEERPVDALEVAQRYDQALSEIGDANTLNWATQAPTLLQTARGGVAQPQPKPLFQRTESLPNAPTPRRFEVKAAQTAGTQLAEVPVYGAVHKRRSLVPGVLLGMILAGGSLALYRYGFDAGANSRRDLATILPSPTTTSTPEPTPTPTPKPTRAANDVKAPATIKPIAPTPSPRDGWPGPTPDGRFGPPPDGRPDRHRPLFDGRRPPDDGRQPPLLSGAEREQRIAMNRQFSQQQLVVARRLYDQGLYKGALRGCETALRLDPGNVEAAALKKKIQEALKILNDKNDQ
jgi:serine/threonine protein kinase